jgi:ribose transport system permease protein
MIRKLIARSFNEYGMAVVLVLLCVYYTVVTMQSRPRDGADGGRDAAAQLAALSVTPKSVVIVANPGTDTDPFVDAVTAGLKKSTGVIPTTIVGDPHDFAVGMKKSIAAGNIPDALIVNPAAANWVDRVINDNLPQLKSVRIVIPSDERHSSFFNRENLNNVMGQTSVYAIVAVGMTMVIITGGIDLSVGSLIALAAVVVARLLHDHGNTGAGVGMQVLCSAAAIAAAGLVGLFTGWMVTGFNVPPFIATLAMMLVASGFAFKISNGESVNGVPESFGWLGNGFGYLGVPIKVMLTAVLFMIAHVIMSRTRLGRYIYAVGGNREAARLSGVRVTLVLMITYLVSGLCAGVGGVILASQFVGAEPTYGVTYELSVIAAVVVGGTSLNGGEGKVFSTLIGALIIAVIQNGMNVTHVDYNDQKIVLGFVLLGAVLLDQMKRKSWRLPSWLRPEKNAA